jgi:DNA replication protein DnaC
MDINGILQRPEGTLLEREYNCKLCQDTQFQEVTQNGISGVKPCVCQAKLRMDYLNSMIPVKFQGAELVTLKPIVTKHVKQTKIIDLIRQNPFHSYLFLGTPGAGKTWFGYALFKNAATSGRRAVAMSMAELIGEFKHSELSRDNWKPKVTAEDLRQNHTKYTIFIDELEKSRFTEFVAEKFFDLIKTAWDFDHQIIATSNLTEDALVQHFSNNDDYDVWGPAIIRRLTEDAKVVEMF